MLAELTSGIGANEAITDAHAPVATEAVNVTPEDPAGVIGPLLSHKYAELPPA